MNYYENIYLGKKKKLTNLFNSLEFHIKVHIVN